MTRWRRWGVCAMALVALPVCRRAADERPIAALASTPESEAEFGAIVQEWSRDPKSRALLRPRLATLVAKLGKNGDGLEPLARAYLAVAWLDEGVPAAAEATARPLLEGPPGVPADLGALVKGAAARRQGRSAEALTLLRPLVGKLIDPFAQPLLYEELVEACLDEGRYEDAIVYAEGWLRSAPAADQGATRAAVARVLARLPSKVAAELWEQNRVAAPELRYSPDLLLILQDRADQGESASLDAGDGDSGKEKDKEPKVTSTSDAGYVAPVDLGPLTRFDPRAVAFLLPISQAGQGTPSAAITRAASVVLEPSLTSPFAPKDAGVDAPAPKGVGSAKHRLGVFDTSLGVAKAFELAEKQGAGVVVGGLVESEADALALLAQQRRVPTILLRPPRTPPTLGPGERRHYVVLGPTRAEELAWTLGVAPTGVVVRVEPVDAPPPKEPDARCDASPKVAGGHAFPVELWREKKVVAVVVLGDARCAERVAEDLRPKPGTNWKPTLVLGLGAMEQAYSTFELPRVVVGVGLLPMVDDAPPLARLLVQDQGSAVGYYGGLGHDAAALALSALPGDLLESTDPPLIQKNRATTLGRLLVATGELWTSTDKGPGPSGQVGHVPSVKSVPAGQALHPSWLAKP